MDNISRERADYSMMNSKGQNLVGSELGWAMHIKLSILLSQYFFLCLFTGIKVNAPLVTTHKATIIYSQASSLKPQ